MENVKGFEESETREHFTRVLSVAGFQFQEYLLSPEQFGIPNSRLRYYLIATRGKLHAPSTGTVITEPPSLVCGAPASDHGDVAETVAEVRVGGVADGQGAVVKRRRVAHAGPYPVCHSIRNYLEPDVDGDPAIAAAYELDAKTVCRLTRVLDIVTPDSTRSMCFTKAYGTYAEVSFCLFACLCERGGGGGGGRRRKVKTTLPLLSCMRDLVRPFSPILLLACIGYGLGASTRASGQGWIA